MLSKLLLRRVLAFMAYLLIFLPVTKDLSPWKFPLNLEAHKVAPAIVVGCPFLPKPVAGPPLSALILGDILHRLEELPQEHSQCSLCHWPTCLRLMSGSRT